MAYNLWCNNHLDENCEHRTNCTTCNLKGTLVSEVATVICPMNNKKLKVMGETVSGGLMMSKEQQRAALSARSKKHFQTDIKENAEQMHKDMIKASTKT